MIKLGVKNYQEYHIGRDFDQSKVVVQAKFTFSPFEKQIKITIENQVEKQIKAIEGNGKI